MSGTDLDGRNMCFAGDDMRLGAVNPVSHGYQLEEQSVEPETVFKCPSCGESVRFDVDEGAYFSVSHLIIEIVHDEDQLFSAPGWPCQHTCRFTGIISCHRGQSVRLNSFPAGNELVFPLTKNDFRSYTCLHRS